MKKDKILLNSDPICYHLNIIIVAPSMPILSSTIDGTSTSGGNIAGAGLPPFMSTGLGTASNSGSLAAVTNATGSSTATTTSQSSTAASAAATMAAAMFPEDMDDHDMGRLQAMLEARGFPPHLAGVLGKYNKIISKADTKLQNASFGYC